MTEPVQVDIENVTLSFGGNKVLDNISLSIRPGEFFALLGPSGCGKSTLLRLIAGFNHAQAGRIRVAGEDITDVPPWKRNVGMVFQSYALWPHLSVRQNVAFGLEEKRLPRDQVREGVARALQLVGLADLADRKPGQISGGQQQRVALARTLAMEPRVLLLDEPLSNLDAKLRHHMRLELVSLQRRLGITTIFVTHDQEEALTTADRLAVMDGGVLQQVGSPMALFDAPASRFVAEFIGSINLVRGTLRRESPDRARFRCGAGEIVLPLTEETASDAERGVQHMGQPMAQHTEQNTAKPAAEYGAQGASGDKGERIAEGTEERNAQRTQERTLAFRPHSLALRRPDAPADPALAWIPAQVSEREFLGEFIRYRLRAGDIPLVADVPHRRGEAGFANGEPVQAGIDPGQVRIFAD